MRERILSFIRSRKLFQITKYLLEAVSPQEDILQLFRTKQIELEICI